MCLKKINFSLREQVLSHLFRLRIHPTWYLQITTLLVQCSILHSKEKKFSLKECEIYLRNEWHNVMKNEEKYFKDWIANCVHCAAKRKERKEN